MPNADTSIKIWALLQRGLLKVEQGNIESAVDDLSESLALPLESAGLDLLRGNIANGDICMILNAASQLQWPRLGKQVCEKLSELDMLGALGRSLVRHLAVLQKSEQNTRHLEAWNCTWQELGAKFESMEISLRLLDVGTRYLISQKPEVLLDLPIEARRILKKVLGLGDPSP